MKNRQDRYKVILTYKTKVVVAVADTLDLAYDYAMTAESATIIDTWQNTII